MLVVGAIILFSSCTQPDANSITYLQAAYFSPTDSGVQSGGAKLISINTPKGKFNIWTKRVGNNPTIKLLLLNGGPGARMNISNAWKTFYLQQELSLSIMINLVVVTPLL